MIYLFDNQERLIKIIRDKVIKEAYHTQTLTEERFVSERLTVYLKGQHKSLLDQVEYIGIPASNNRLHYFFLAKHTSNTLEGVTPIESLRKYIIEDQRPTDQPPRPVIERLLQGTNWRVGFVEAGVRASTRFYYIPVFEALKKVCEVWDLEMQFFVEFTENRISARTIDFKRKLGKASGARVTKGHNALEILYESDASEIITAAIGRGKGIEVSSEEQNESRAGYGRKIMFDDISSTNPVKPKGQKYVENPQATAKYGVKVGDRMIPKFGIVEYDTEDKQELLRRTWEYLQENCRPKVVFKTTTAYLKGAEIGDTVRVVDPIERYDFDVRVFEIVRDVLGRQTKEIKLGDQVASTESRLVTTLKKKVQERVMDEVVSSLPSANGYNRNWYGGEPDKPRVGDIWYQDDAEHEGEKIMLSWDGEHWNEIVRTYRDDTPIQNQLKNLKEESAKATDAKLKEFDNKLTQAESRINQTTDSKVAQAIRESQDSLNERLNRLDQEDAKLLEALRNASDANLAHNSFGPLPYDGAPVETDMYLEAGKEYVLTYEGNYDLADTADTINYPTMEPDDRRELFGNKVGFVIRDKATGRTANQRSNDNRRLVFVVPVDGHYNVSIYGRPVSKIMVNAGIEPKPYSMNREDVAGKLNLLERDSAQLSNRITDLDNDVSSRIRQTANSLSTQVAQLDNKTSTRLTQLSDSIQTKVADATRQTETKITQLSDRLTSTVRDANSQTDSKLNQLSDRLTVSINNSKTQTESKITQLSDSLQLKLTDLQRDTQTKITALSDGIRTEVGKIKVGGRNYIRNSNFHQGREHWVLASDITILPDTDFPYGAKILGNTRDRDFVGIEQEFRIQKKAGTSITVSAKLLLSIEQKDRGNGIVVGIHMKKSGKIVAQKWEMIPALELPYFGGIPYEFKQTFELTTDVDAIRIHFQHQHRKRNTPFSFQVAMSKCEEGTIATDWTPAPEDSDAQTEAVRTQVTQLGNSWAVRTLTSNNAVLSQINLTNGDVKIDGKLVHITGKTLIDDATIDSSKIKTLNADKITTGTLNGANVNVINLNASNITSGQMSANRIRGGVLEALNGNTRFDLNQAKLQFNSNAGIEFNSSQNALYRIRGQGTAFLRFNDSALDGVYVQIGATGHGYRFQNPFDAGTAYFAGLNIFRDTAKERDEIIAMGDRIELGHGARSSAFVFNPNKMLHTTDGSRASVDMNKVVYGCIALMRIFEHALANGSDLTNPNVKHKIQSLSPFFLGNNAGYLLDDR